MFASLLIANRGEIACRIMRTAKRLGLRTVAVYSDADRNALHVAAADAAIRLGPAPARHSYLNQRALLAAAAETGAQAIHPGYGFLAENAEFAEACEAAGIRFVGPPSSAIRTMGRKADAKALMADAGVAVLPGYEGERQDAETLEREARALGYPLMIKAQLGGGGKGMRLVRQSSQFAASLKSARREAQASFGDGRVLLERAVARPRHVEVQIFADRHGNVVHLFERDCSVQRRHQKVLEEAPAPDLDENLRGALADAAVMAARAIAYEGAGTVEFIVECDPTGAARDFYFLEMNTRLQVEHAVTELITDSDLVEWQLRVAAGETLPRAQNEIRRTGHAIEARLYAEDPTRGFLPATGTLSHLALPEESADLRVDIGVREGDAVGVDYDPMIAKIVARGEDRIGALRRLRDALEAVEVAGVVTNRDFLAAVVSDPCFSDGAVDTGFIDARAGVLVPESSAADSRVIAIATLFELLNREEIAAAAARESDDRWSPWNRTGAWRLNRPARDMVTFVEEGQEIEVRVAFEDQGYRLEWPEGSVHVRGTLGPGRTLNASIDGRDTRATVVADARERWIILAGTTHRLARSSPGPRACASRQLPGLVTAPMPGKITAVHVRTGDRVRVGQVLMVLDAMKMEHAVCATRDGVIEDLRYSQGDQVSEGAELLVIDGEGE